MKKLSLALTLGIVAMLLIALPVFMPEPVSAMTGSGTEEDPFIIYGVTDLQNMANNLTAYYELANDIDASQTSTWNGGSGFIPVGTFTGHLDGNYYKIVGLYMNWANNDTYRYGGLFSSLGTGASVSNLRIIDAYIRIYKCEVGGTNQVYAGVLCGQMYQSDAQVIRVYTSGECYAYLCSNTHTFVEAGGLIGRIYGGSPTISQCAANVYTYADSVDGGGTYTNAAAYAGGLIGRIEQGAGCSACFPVSD